MNTDDLTAIRAALAAADTSTLPADVLGWFRATQALLAHVDRFTPAPKPEAPTLDLPAPPPGTWWARVKGAAVFHLWREEDDRARGCSVWRHRRDSITTTTTKTSRPCPACLALVAAQPVSPPYTFPVEPE